VLNLTGAFLKIAAPMSTLLKAALDVNRKPLFRFSKLE
jgi:hypothetical protein